MAKDKNDSTVIPTNGQDNALVLFKAMNENLPSKSLCDTLVATIDKVKTDPKYIEQARAINETAKTLIELGRLQVEIMRTAKGARS